MSVNTQSAIDRFLSRGGVIKRVAESVRNYSEADMRAAARGDDISDAEYEAVQAMQKRFADVEDEDLSRGVRMDFNGDLESCVVLA